MSMMGVVHGHAAMAARACVVYTALHHSLQHQPAKHALPSTSFIQRCSIADPLPHQQACSGKHTAQHSTAQAAHLVQPSMQDRSSSMESLWAWSSNSFTSV